MTIQKIGRQTACRLDRYTLYLSKKGPQISVGKIGPTAIHCLQLNVTIKFCLFRKLRKIIFKSSIIPSLPGKNPRQNNRSKIDANFMTTAILRTSLPKRFELFSLPLPDFIFFLCTLFYHFVKRRTFFSACCPAIFGDCKTD